MSLFKYIPAYIAIRAAGRAPGGYPTILLGMILGVVACIVIVGIGIAFIVITGV